MRIIIIKGNKMQDHNLLTETSKQILAALPHCTDADLKILYGRLTLNMYGAIVSDECASYVIAERNRREAIAI